ncbi:uncharacterized protein N7487_002552 [Penicillium crustosum]|uniref:uncharacterized protein n=1 Tax=Penicillium crustosum TaxID=36656 RepID=UPI002382644E|nr:uncharacterized protein N7487_002552 [Penicillium crustosum]KAJ5419002.1 hypothetical protein N7487_002552 [Penicillium crustosum]
MSLNCQAIVSYPPEHKRPWNAKLEDVSIRDIKPDECLVDIVASGICHTDLGIASRPESIFPRVLGHESAGYLRKIGSDVPRSPMNLKEGDPVLLSIAFCGACPSCRAGHPSYCYDAYGLNFAHPGCDSYQVILAPGQDTTAHVVGGFFGQSSLGSLAVARANCIVSLAGIVKSREELQLFAPLGCGFQTGAGTVSNLGKAQPNDSVAIIGLGGVGLSAVMAAKIIGCRRIIAVDRIPDRLSLATELGATHVIHTGELTTSLTDAVKLATEGLGSSLTIDTTGVLSIIRESLDMTSVLGRMVLLGMAKDSLEIDMTKFKLAGKTLLGSVQGDVIPSKMIEWYRAGRFPIEKLVRFYKPEDHTTAIQDMKAGHTVKPIIKW